MQFGILLLQFGILPLQFGILLQQFGILPLKFGILPLQFGILPLQFGILPLQFGILPLQFGILPLEQVNSRRVHAVWYPATASDCRALVCSLRNCHCSRAITCAYMQFENLPVQPGSSHVAARNYFWVNNSLKIKVHKSRLYCIHFTSVVTSNFPLCFRGKGIFNEKTSIPANTGIDIFEIPVLYRPRPVLKIQYPIGNTNHCPPSTHTFVCIKMHMTFGGSVKSQP
jgi:hypothetical protein